ncbi:ATPase [Halothiobacillus diazotrophicus]|uniref:P-type Cu(+) transporter n=1 Tax=Halothiobacillus diazotrophicus TaxID=1860122 RepID=A0A191ZKD0_9GAMM|nr:cation-translocating P-type ATPase [Halothiobacillus diazotrophicus]ANJ68361.1 ATPase [Halothiobacillus diazotrophicus]
MIDNASPELHGLTSAAAAERLAAEGLNELGQERRRTLWAIAGEVIREPMFLLLLGAGAIYLLMGDVHEALILLGFVGIIMGVTILQERRTEHALDMLRTLSSPRALAIRDGVPVRIAGAEVVREDVLMLTEGDRVPADGFVVEAHELAADESLLTGESEPVAKFPADSDDPTDAARDRVFAGTMIVRGQGLMCVTTIGAQTELGRIGKSLQAIGVEASPLRTEIARLTRRLALIGAGLSLFLAGLFWALRGDALHGLLAGITLAMGILPQEFPVIMIVFFALGARRIAAHQVLTRRLNAIETLGETTVLCVDKTGTLTRNRMALAALSVEGQLLVADDLAARDLPEHYHELMEYAVLASEIDPSDPMEQAFHRFAQDYLADTEHLHPDWALTREYELSPALPAMSHLWRDGSLPHDVVAAKGAPEAIADLCHLDPIAHEALRQSADAMAARGWRVLAVAKSTHPSGQPFPDRQHDFPFALVGLIGLADPLRPEVPAAIEECHRAGIRVVMITGDHPGTARAIAEQAGIDAASVATGEAVAAMDSATLAARVAETDVFARVTPAQKLMIVSALKRDREVVAMTGDGVNDAPALKAAHIGIAMGRRGTDVAREAASLVLLEDDFTAIVAAIRLGRRIFANLRQALVYTVAVHMPIIGLSIVPVLFGWPMILMPIHIAFLELVIDPACSIVFEAEKGRRGLMTQPPRPPTEPLIAARHLGLSVVQGAVTTVAALACYSWALSLGVATDSARALAFIVVVVANAVLILSARSPDADLHRLFSGLSPVALWVLGLTLLGLAAIIGLPGLAGAFDFQPPPGDLALAAAALGVSLLLPFEGVKRLFRPR